MNILWLFVTVLWVGLQCVIVVFSDHNHLFFHYIFQSQRLPQPVSIAIFVY